MFINRKNIFYMQHKKLISLVVFMFTLIASHAQERVVATGGYASGIGGTISYSVSSIQEPYDITVITGIEENEFNLTYLVYPNPTTDNLILKVSNPDLSTLNFQLYNIKGQILLSKQIVVNEINISMSRYEKGIYFLKIRGGKAISFKEIKTFKIIKK